MMRGYFNQYLRIDATRASSECIPLGSAVLRQFIGGAGLGTRLLLEECASGVDALAPEAAIVFAFSPFVGTSITTSAKFAVVAKSPLTGRINDALSSSDFAVAGKRAGYDAIVVTGRAGSPSVVLIDEDGARFEPCDLPAQNLWGRGLPIDEVDAALTARYPGYHFAIIGTAGERLVSYASVANDKRHAGRGGHGAVLGSKQIKAIGVRGKRIVPIADRDALVALSKDLAQRSLGAATAKYRELGTVANLAAFNRLAVLPTRNFQQGHFEGAEALSGEQLHLTRNAGRSSCRNCTIGCEHFFRRDEGAPVKLEYESLFALGPLCGIADPDVVLRAAALCDDLGLDTISAGACIAFAMECSERGLLDGTPYQADLSFGNGQHLLALLEAIATRNGALADLLAQGTRHAAGVLGPPTQDFAPHVKGLELPGYEPRALQTMALGFAVGSRGADHNKSGAYEIDFSTKVDRFAPDLDAAKLAVETEDRAALIDSLILCKFLRGVFGDLYAESATILRAVTGEDFSAAELTECAERIVLAKKLYNIREGWTRSEDTLPKRFFVEDNDGVHIDPSRLDGLIGAYYEARGWREDGTVPAETAARAELVEFALER